MASTLVAWMRQKNRSWWEIPVIAVTGANAPSDGAARNPAGWLAGACLSKPINYFKAFENS